MPRHLSVSAADAAQRFRFADLAPGDHCTERVGLDERSFDVFARLSGDTAPVHTDDAEARAAGYDGRILPGFLSSLRFSRLLGMFLPGALSVIHSTRFEYVAPLVLKPNEATEVAYAVTIVRTIEPLKAVILDLGAELDGQAIVRGSAQCVMRQ